MRDVAVLGIGMHPWGKFAEKSVTELCRHAVEAALADAGLNWREVDAVAAASSRFSGGKGWGLNGNDVVEDMGSTGIPVYNMSAGCAAGANAFNIGHTLVASGLHDVVLVVGGEKMPKGFIQTSHGGVRHQRRGPRRDRRQGSQARRPQRERALPQGVQHGGCAGLRDGELPPAPL